MPYIYQIKEKDGNKFWRGKVSKSGYQMMSCEQFRKKLRKKLT